MLNLADHMRRLKVDKYEYVAMKVIVLLSSGRISIIYWVSIIIIFLTYSIIDTAELKEPEKVRTSQEKALQALQAYTLCKNENIIIPNKNCYK